MSATVTDQAGNSAPAVSASLTLDTTADLGDDLTVSIDSVINDTESGTVQITVSGVDADVASPDGIVVTVGDPSTDTGALSAAQTAEADAESDLASLNSQLNTLVQIAGLEQLGVTELNITLGDLEGDEAGPRPRCPTRRATTIPPTRRRVARSWQRPRTGCPDRGRLGGCTGHLAVDLDRRRRGGGWRDLDAGTDQ